jgi:hypothetical protein
MADDEIDGARVAQWARSDGADLRLLVGCRFFDDDSEDGAAITGIESEALLCGRRRLAMRALGAGVVVPDRPDHPLFAAIDGAKTQGQRAAEAAQARVQDRVGRVVDLADAELLLATLEDHAAGVLPPPDARRLRLKALRKNKVFTEGEAVVRGWIRLALGRREVATFDLHRGLVGLLRDGSRYEDALEEVRTYRRLGRRPDSELLVLAVLEAELLMDVHEKKRRSRERLEEAGKALTWAAGIRHSHGWGEHLEIEGARERLYRLLGR